MNVSVKCKEADKMGMHLTVGKTYDAVRVNAYIEPDPEGRFYNLIDDAGGKSSWSIDRFVEQRDTEELTALGKDIVWRVDALPPPTTVKVRPRGSDLQPQTESSVRTFGTGATRDLDANKLDFEGFLSPLVLERYAQHMHKARRMPDGSMRDSDNWQLGIPVSAYMKSLWRHFYAVWRMYRGLKYAEVIEGKEIEKDIETELCALLFNANGMLHELLKAKRASND